METGAEGAQYLTVADVARLFSVTPDAVRRWDGLGQLQPAMRLGNGMRLYDPEAVARFADERGRKLVEPSR
jgi:DNA-binding transcriptional MerR regulator